MVRDLLSCRYLVIALEFLDNRHIIINIEDNALVH
jgi:hypothetical protein